jgi:hypothetical protein
MKKFVIKNAKAISIILAGLGVVYFLLLFFSWGSVPELMRAPLLIIGLVVVLFAGLSLRLKK